MTETVTSTGSYSFGIWQCVTECAVQGDAVQQGTTTSWSTDKYAPTDTVSHRWRLETPATSLWEPPMLPLQYLSYSLQKT